MGIRHHSLVVGLIMLVLLPGAQALSFGSLAKTTSQDVPAGEMAAFDILVWNREGASYPVQFAVDSVPEKWSIDITPQEFELGQQPAGETEIIALPGKTVTAQVVTVQVQVPFQSKGTHEIVISAIAGAQDSPISILQERTFRLEVSVTDPVDPFGQFFDFLGGSIRSITGFTVGDDEGVGMMTLLTIGLLFIGFIVWRIYRHD